MTTRNMIQMAPGGWLAIDIADRDVPIGVFGQTREEAASRLDAAMIEREVLHAQTTPSDT